MKKVVTIGGGTGSFMLLSGLKEYPIELSAIVSMADDDLGNEKIENVLSFSHRLKRSKSFVSSGDTERMSGWVGVAFKRRLYLPVRSPDMVATGIFPQLKGGRHMSARQFSKLKGHRKRSPPANIAGGFSLF